MLTLERAFPNRVAGVIRSDDPDIAFRACLAAIEGGMATIEVTTTVPSCYEIVRGLVASTRVPIGVGTVWDPAAVEEAARAGAAFVVTPAVLPEVAEASSRLDILCVLGALTPTEIYSARQAGADMVKVFPVAAAGGPAYIRYLNGPMPGVPLWVSGGVEIDQIGEYLRLGVKAVGLTTALFAPELLSSGDMAGVTERARAATAGQPSKFRAS
jgi:2-dehydro-3-deoxyphosphogluconate aldolase/(4S)-4-hydroxy-2-oxoglutarate aldolase